MSWKCWRASSETKSQDIHLLHCCLCQERNMPGPLTGPRRRMQDSRVGRRLASWITCGGQPRPSRNTCQGLSHSYETHGSHAEPTVHRGLFVAAASASSATSPAGWTLHPFLSQCLVSPTWVFPHSLSAWMSWGFVLSACCDLLT